MRFLWILLLLPACGGCVMHDEFQSYEPASACAPPAPSACSGGYRSPNTVYAPMAAYTPQTPEPPR